MTDPGSTRARDEPRLDPPPGSTRARASWRSPKPVGAERAALRARFGGLLFGERLVRGWSQARLAEVAGLHVDTIADYEVGRLRPTDVACHRLAAALRAEGGDPVAVAELSIVLQIEAGESLRLVNRRRPQRVRWRRAYSTARARREARQAEELDAVVGYALAAMEPDPDERDPWAGARRPAVRP